MSARKEHHAKAKQGRPNAVMLRSPLPLRTMMQTMWSIKPKHRSKCQDGVSSGLNTQSGAVQAAESRFHLSKHWCRVVPLSWMALISALSWSRLISTVLHYPLFYSETQAELPTSPPLYTQTSYLMPFDIDLELRNNKKNYSELYMYKLYSSTNDSPSIFHKYFIRFRVTGRWSLSQLSLTERCCVWWTGQPPITLNGKKVTTEQIHWIKFVSQNKLKL